MTSVTRDSEFSWSVTVRSLFLTPPTMAIEPTRVCVTKRLLLMIYRGIIAAIRNEVWFGHRWYISEIEVKVSGNITRVARFGHKLEIGFGIAVVLLLVLQASIGYSSSVIQYNQVDSTSVGWPPSSYKEIAL